MLSTSEREFSIIIEIATIVYEFLLIDTDEVFLEDSVIVVIDDILILID
jgi:hypothetical protein